MKEESDAVLLDLLSDAEQKCEYERTTASTFVYVCVSRITIPQHCKVMGIGNRMCVYVCLFLVSLSPSIAGRLEPRFESVCLEAVGFFRSASQLVSSGRLGWAAIAFAYPQTSMWLGFVTFYIIIVIIIKNFKSQFNILILHANHSLFFINQQPHNNKLLVKYLYKKNTGHEHSHTSSSSTAINIKNIKIIIMIINNIISQD